MHRLRCVFYFPNLARICSAAADSGLWAEQGPVILSPSRLSSEHGSELLETGAVRHGQHFVGWL